ncbi:MAG TPA: pyroglutamyl-peptidase I [Anaerolineales bacterium]|nr:pyroglutamyl-peptidase I [Anaerolineales bacterium]
MAKRILLTGFEPFGEVEANPSQRVVDALVADGVAGVELAVGVLPVSYASAGGCMRRLIRENRPDHVLALGLAAKSEEIRIERVALNLDDSSSPDNDGVLREGDPILADGPPAYFSALPLTGLKGALESAGIPVRISNHAGAYLCNHVYYAAAHEVEQLGLPSRAVFIHVPLPAELGGPAGLSMDAIERAVRLSLQWLAAQ